MKTDKEFLEDLEVKITDAIKLYCIQCNEIGVIIDDSEFIFKITRSGSVLNLDLDINVNLLDLTEEE